MSGMHPCEGPKLPCFGFFLVKNKKKHFLRTSFFTGCTSAVLATLNKALAGSFWGHKPAACFAECLGSPGRVGGGAGKSIVFLGSPGVFCLGGQVLGVVLGGGGGKRHARAHKASRRNAQPATKFATRFFRRKKHPHFSAAGTPFAPRRKLPGQTSPPRMHSQSPPPTPFALPHPTRRGPNPSPMPPAHPPPAFPGRKARRLWDETPAGFCPKETKC